MSENISPSGMYLTKNRGIFINPDKHARLGLLKKLFKPKPNQRVKPKNVFTKIKEAVKVVKTKIEAKTGKPLKQVILHAATKITLAVSRAGLHLFLKLNVFHVAECFRWGTLSESEARAQGVPMERYPKAVAGFEKLKKMHYQIGGEDKVLMDCLQKHSGKYVSSNVNNNQAQATIKVLPKQNDGVKKQGAIIKDTAPKGTVPSGKQGRVSGLLGSLGAAGTLAAISVSLPTILAVVKIGKEAGILGGNKTKIVYAKRPLKGFGDPDPTEQIDAVALSKEVSGSETGEAKVSIIKQLWEGIKAFFSGNKSTNYAEDEEVMYQDEGSDSGGNNGEGSAEKSTTERGKPTEVGDNQSDTPTGDGQTADTTTGSDNTMMYVGAAVALAGVGYMLSTQKPSTTQAAVQGVKKAKVPKPTAEEKKEYFKKHKKEIGFDLK